MEECDSIVVLYIGRTHRLLHLGSKLRAAALEGQGANPPRVSLTAVEWRAARHAAFTVAVGETKTEALSVVFGVCFAQTLHYEPKCGNFQFYP